MWEACILAGGRSSRMGQDKARLRLRGKTLLAHVRTAARQAGFPVRVIRRDLVPGCGPLGGVHAALSSTKAKFVVFLSCDTPFVNAALLRQLKGRLSAEANAVFVVDRGVGFPFVLRQSTLSQVEKLMREEMFALQALARRLKAVRVRLPTAQSLATFNINTPEDFAVAKRYLKTATCRGVR